MGKAQSKRSVDITTETKKGPEGGDEVTGKLEKIEDIDQKQVNGDATPQEKNDAAGEKKDAPDETENEKDLTTEKIAEETTATPSPTDGSGDQANTTATETSPKEDESGAATAASPKEGEEITPLADESLNKKSKKEKVKKKWSFRSISFGKKDKQKPAKTEGSENVAAAAATSSVENAAAATNGDATETNQPAEGATAEAIKQDDAAAATPAEEAKPVEGAEIENGVATDKEQHMNGQKTPTPTTPTDDAEQKKPIETSTAVVNETATAVTTAVTTPAPASSSNETANESHVEVKAPVEKIEAVVTNGTADAEKNGVVHANEHEEQQHEEKPTAQSEDNIKSIPVDEKPHQNGTNGDEGVEEITAATKTLQIEVKTEHQIDSNSSTTTTSTTTTTTTTTIPADNFNTEQKTTTDNLFITSAQTDTHTITNTSDKSLSSNNSIAIIEEQSVSHPNKVLETIEEISKVAVESAESNAIQPNEDADISLQQQQPPQQQEPPPLPLSAPPSQVVIFALSDNENSSDDVPDIQTTSTTALVENEESPLKMTPNELSTEPPTSFEETAEVIEIVETIMRNDNLAIITESIKTTTEDGVATEEFCMAKEIIAEPENINSPIETESIVSVDDVPPITEEEKIEEQIQEPIIVLDDFAAEALIIVDQIQKDLEKEDDGSQQQENESERLLNDIAEILEQQLEKIEPTTEDVKSSAIITEPLAETALIQEEHIENDIPEMVTITPPNSSETTETTEAQDIVELESALSSLSVSKNEIIIPIVNLDEIGQHEIEIDSKSIELSEQESEQPSDQSNQNDEITIEVDEKIIKTNEEESDKEDCSLKSETIESFAHAHAHPIAVISDDKMMSVIGINEKDDELIVSSNKEIPTAKDLKENAAAAEITTQDLPVTCE